MSFKINLVMFVAVGLCCIQADQAEELKLKYMKHLLECVAEYPLPPEEMIQLSKKQLPDSENAKCLLACTYKKSGIMDQDGKLAVEEIRRISETTFAGKPELIKKSEDFINACKHVNDEDIAGDKKECQRAMLIFNCTMQTPHGLAS
uniref:Odorant-binding protein OBP36 n=1 Tax=Lobesia botrana TaxID=209534 RepID=A0A345BEQ9_9NEOP|nr:odorant-binding protein OBP36 [Lobesia botrana]